MRVTVGPTDCGVCLCVISKTSSLRLGCKRHRKKIESYFINYQWEGEEKLQLWNLNALSALRTDKTRSDVRYGEDGKGFGSLGIQQKKEVEYLRKISNLWIF